MTDTVVEVLPDVKSDPSVNVEYLKKCRAVLHNLHVMPMSSHETRAIKDALLVLFAPAFAELSERADLEEVETPGEKPLPVYPPQ